MSSDRQQRGSRPSRLSSWRHVAEGVEPPRSQPGTGESIRHRLADRHRLLRQLLLDTIAELDVTYSAVDAYLDNGNRSALHTQLLDERAGAATRRYEYAVSRLLEQAVIQVTAPPEPRIREVIKPVYVAPPPAKSLLHKLLFGG
jgi:hypothetical protein